MSFAMGALSRSKDVGLKEKREGEEREREENGKHSSGEILNRQISEASLSGSTEDDDDDDDDDDKEGEEAGKGGKGIDLGPQVSLKEQIEKDKDDESLRRWKEQLLGSVDLSSVGETSEPEVKILSLQSNLLVGRILSAILWNRIRRVCGSHYKLKFAFSVRNNIVSGLRYANTVWKTGLKVDSTKEMLGTFSPQLEPYTFKTPEETTPSGYFARGSYSARTKFIDDDRRCYLEINYTFDIRREWPSTTS
ncbi:Rho GDP-dissociation inhibitor 1 [Ananas comosus]|uniref:Rho GDP-dissociation inhibitor 1 n=1 Tax=Ananas comosus TaxID=4615 RepID=A0A199UNY6_ANACO|nr:Rho GDP-dissociation inhibitor 1 [Ananas comosus]